MCGIAGFVRLDGATADSGLLERMTAAITHRGPDAGAVWHEKGVGLGHRRLKIIDLSEAAAQPMHSPDGRYVIIFNGEIYNFAEERAILEKEGHTFRSTGDTEVLLRLYMVHGENCVERLRGQFAFAILDRKKQTLFLARDRVGKKPLVYFHDPNIFAFASESCALRALPECPRDIDWDGLHHFLSLTYLPSPLTGIRGIMKLPAAHCMTVDLASGRATMRRYWNMRYNPVHGRSLGEWKERILAALNESVRLRMIADVPVGAFLSGGVDSSAVVALMSRMHTQPVKTFSIGSNDGRSELPDAQRISDAFGTEHHPISLEPDIVKLLPSLVDAYDSPIGDPSVIPTYLIAQSTRETVTVALSGDGGDEAFGGYTRYPILRFSESVRPLRALMAGPTRLLRDIRPTTLTYRTALFWNTLHLPWPERVQHYMGGFTDDEKRMVESTAFPPSGTRTGPWFSGLTADARSRGDDLVHRAMNADLETYLAEDLLPKVDLGSMAHGLEVRSPFLDHVLLELSAELPSALQVRGWKTKWILKQALEGVLPQETLHKRKQGFRLPLDAWFRGPLRPYVTDRLHTGNPLFWQMFDRTGVEGLLRAYYGSSVDYSPQIWMLLWLQEWLARRV